VDPRAGLDDMEKGKFFTLKGLELPPTHLGRPARSQSLYRLNTVLYISSKFIKFSLLEITWSKSRADVMIHACYLLYTAHLH
jgi:hypothetical protein